MYRVAAARAADQADAIERPPQPVTDGGSRRLTILMARLPQPPGLNRSPSRFHVGSAVFHRSAFQKPARRLSRERLLRLLGLVLVLALAGLLRDRFAPSPGSRAAEAWTIQTVHDGDTVTAVAADGREERIRLVGIDAPEYRQAHGQEARAALEQKVRGQPIRLESHGRDQYDRLLGTLWIDQRNLNRELVAEGHAWVFDRFAPPADLLEAQQTARRDRRGLWATPQPLRPSEWRQAHPRRP